MESYIDIVDAKQKKYLAYKAFIQEVEEKIQNEACVKDSQISRRLEKSTTTEEAVTRLHLKAEFIKDSLSEQGFDT